MNELNLQKIADHTRQRSQESFDMWHFRSVDFEARVVNNNINIPCGSLACVIGDCIHLFKPKPSEGWNDYSERITGVTDDNEWEYMFGSRWKDVDNTPEGAADRIEHFIAFGLPEDWIAQMNGEATLSYKPKTNK